MKSSSTVISNLKSPSKYKVVEKFFVYGTLRPDIKACYSHLIHNNTEFDIKFDKAYIEYAKIYAFTEQGYPTIIFSNNKEDKVHGYIIRTEKPEDSNKLLEVTDYIECYPELYTRVNAFAYNELSKKYETVNLYLENEKLRLHNSLIIDQFFVKETKETKENEKVEDSFNFNFSVLNNNNCEAFKDIKEIKDNEFNKLLFIDIVKALFLKLISLF